MPYETVGYHPTRAVNCGILVQSATLRGWKDGPPSAPTVSLSQVQYLAVLKCVFNHINAVFCGHLQSLIQLLTYHVRSTAPLPESKEQQVLHPPNALRFYGRP